MSIDKKEVLSNTLPKKLLTRKEAAKLLSVSSGTLAVWLCCKRYDLPYIKVGRLVKYLLKIIKMVIIVDKNYHNMIEFAKKEVFWTAIASICAAIGLIVAYRQSRNKKVEGFKVKIIGYIMSIDVDKADYRYIDIHFKISNPFNFDYILHEITILYDGYWFTSSGNIKTETYYINKLILNNSNLEHTIKMSSAYDPEWQESLDDSFCGMSCMFNKTIVVKTNREEYTFAIKGSDEITMNCIIKLLNDETYHHKI